MAPTIMMTTKDLIAGTPEYMSPEQWEVLHNMHHPSCSGYWLWY
jgi:hypothetical protein